MGLAGSAKNEFAARFGAVSGTYSKRVMIVLWVFVGLIAAGLHQGGLRLSDPDSAWGTLSREFLGPGLLGVMLVGLLAANMASVATKTMAVSALVVRNLYRPMVARPDDRREVMIGRVAGAVALAASVGAAMAMKETLAVTKLILTINLPFGAAVMLMFFWRRLTRSAVWWCILLTGALIIVEPLGVFDSGGQNSSAGAWILARAGLGPEGPGPGGLLAAQFIFDAIFPFCVLVVVSLFTRPPSEASVAQFFGKMKTPIGASRALDDAAMAETLANPSRFDGEKLFPGSSWEFTRWDRTDVWGFLACCTISLSIITMLWVVLRFVL
jgi:Na+/proline symporter